MTGKYLITTEQWFIAPDGIQYKAVWGDVKIVDDTVLGVKTNRGSTNWYAKVGSDENHVIVAGCQIHYACRCEKEPNTKGVTDWQMDASNYNDHLTPTKIYIASI